MNEKQILPRKGLLCSVYRTLSLKGCSNGGISEQVETVVLVGPGIPEIFSPKPRMPAVQLVKTGDYMHVEPVEQPDGMCGPMAGGAFIYTSDSRFPSNYPISLHDRFDTREQYDLLSR